MGVDFGYETIEVNEMCEILDSFQGKTVYLKSVVAGEGGDEFATYNKMQVKSCLDVNYAYFLYGQEDRDMILIGKNNIRHCEKKIDDNGIHIKVFKVVNGTSITIYLHDCGKAVI